MSDEHHARFGAWMASGALGEPPRDAALHASVCDGCLGLVAARDALAAIDTGRAALPPSRLGHRKRAMPMLRVARIGLATAAVAMLGAALAFGASQLIAGRRLPLAREPAPTFAGGVLGGVSGPSASGRSSPRSTATPTAKATESASPTPALTPSAGEAPPAVPPPPLGSLAASASPSNPSPTPSSAQTTTPTHVPTPSPSPTASPTPSPSPTASPTPSPTPMTTAP